MRRSSHSCSKPELGAPDAFFRIRLLQSLKYQCGEDLIADLEERNRTIIVHIIHGTFLEDRDDACLVPGFRDRSLTPASVAQLPKIFDRLCILL